MKVICLQEHLKNGLNIAQNIVGKNLILPILNNILLETKNGRLQISSTNLELGLHCWIMSKIEKEGKITVPAKIFNSFINNLPTGEKVELELKNNELYVKCENYTANFKCLEADEFPIIPEIENDPFCILDTQVFKKSLLPIVNLTAISESRLELTGILFKFNKNNLKMTATDSFRLGEKSIYNLNLAEEKSIILPQRTIQELIRILNETEEGVIKIIFNQNQIKFELNNIQLISRLIDGQYPEYEQIVPQEFKMQILFDKDKTLNLIKTAGFFSGKNNLIQLIVYPQKSLLEVFSQDNSLGENRSNLPVEIVDNLLDKEVKKIEINLNYRYFLDGLMNLDKEKVILGVNAESSPLIIKEASDNTYFYLLMPIRS